jgi:hypothetical protein
VVNSGDRLHKEDLAGLTERVRSGVATLISMKPRPWPVFPDEYRWTVEVMKELLAESDQSPEGMRARARELREEAEASKIKGERDAALTLADHYEEAAAVRVAGARS